MSKRLPASRGGASIVWSPVNQAYLILWRGSVLRVIRNRAEAVQEFNRIVGVK